MSPAAFVFPATPADALKGKRWEPWVPANAWPFPGAMPALPPNFFRERACGASPDQIQAMALYAVVDTFWRVSQWLDEQGPGAFVSWRLDLEAIPTGLDEDYRLIQRQCLVIDLLPAKGKSSEYPLDEELAKDMANVLKKLSGQDLHNGVWDASVSMDQRLEMFLGPSYEVVHRAQRLEKDLPLPDPSPRKPRF